MKFDLSDIDPGLTITVKLNTKSIAISVDRGDLPSSIRDAVLQLPEYGLDVSRHDAIRDTAYVFGFGVFDPVQLAERIAGEIETEGYTVQRIYAHKGIGSECKTCQSFILA